MLKERRADDDDCHEERCENRSARASEKRRKLAVEMSGGSSVSGHLSKKDEIFLCNNVVKTNLSLSMSLSKQNYRTQLSKQKQLWSLCIVTLEQQWNHHNKNSFFVLEQVPASSRRASPRRPPPRRVRRQQRRRRRQRQKLRRRRAPKRRQKAPRARAVRRRQRGPS